MPSQIHRRAFLAVSALTLPAVAIAKGSSASTLNLADEQFEDNMKQAGSSLKSMRRFMRDVSDPINRKEAAYHANQVTIALANCIAFADQAPIPARSESKYKGDEEQFTQDLQIKLSASVSAANALGRALLLGNEKESLSLYDSLRNERNEGHDEFEDDD